ncbi:MFS transporter [Enterobacteriaceae bacterium RIT691]|nr:MFS transporter [Enterobacteriaceae bacterium RIT691]
MNKQKEAGLGIKNWLALLILSLSTFAIVTTELAPVGLLTPMAEGLQRSESSIGLLVTLYAWVGAVSALLSSLFLSHISRKVMLLGLMMTICVSNIMCATLGQYNLLLVARIIGAFGHGAFWAMIGATAISLVPARFIGLATSIVFGGVSVASILGVPLSNYIALSIDWRAAFWLMALLSVVAFIGIMLLVPAVKTHSALALDSLKHVLKDRSLWKVYIATLLAITAHFAAFTFIEPWLQSAGSVMKSAIPVLLFAFGLAGLAGNFLTGMVVDRWLKVTVISSVLATALTLLVFGHSAHMLTQGMIVAFIVLWGIAVSGMFVGLQTWVLRLAAENAFPASAIYITIFNTAIGCGSLLGAWIINSYDLNVLMMSAGLTIITTVAVIALIPAHRQQVAEKQENVGEAFSL